MPAEAEGEGGFESSPRSQLLSSAKSIVYDAEFLTFRQLIDPLWFAVAQAALDDVRNRLERAGPE